MTVTEQSRNEAWTRQALAHKDGQGKAVAEVTIAKSAPVEFPKDEDGQTIIPSNVGTKAEQEAWRKQKLHKGTPKSPFAGQSVPSTFTDF